ncbi:hypothetical protein GYMLUDRAFT_592357 [Collybiopsis luxurians FD-317 M1]|uniref:Unplaced genomic scaffold GYMLUscaffold_24, whole genome shotgun sequence n=1 Tax=Collybiopsis luxurians FD-317 M1 TaxID=944289 RepID=A0A0D0CY37_9AGAR|nr:hypothetical protein GYMLUDRAFT_592357 [Collybiopsis luxurians FD-317 M1]
MGKLHTNQYANLLSVRVTIFFSAFFLIPILLMAQTEIHIYIESSESSLMSSVSLSPVSVTFCSRHQSS